MQTYVAGERLRKLVLIKRARNFGSKVRWVARCDCGNEIIVIASLFRKGKYKSCVPCQVSRNLRRTTNPLFVAWMHMHERCQSTWKQRKDYFDRGISVCDRWKDFNAFCDDMGARPKGHTLERKNNDLGYEPDNCVWATRAQQSRNTRQNVWVVGPDGQSMVLQDAICVFGLSHSGVYWRIKRYGESAQEAINYYMGGDDGVETSV